MTEAMTSEREMGLFGPRSQTWRISREALVLLGGRRALLMQLAHPLVAQGVADHSGFKQDRIGRLLATLRASFDLVFSDDDVAMSTINKVEAAHARVSGVLEQDAGIYPAGTPYSATDPELLLWVHATLVDTAIAFYSRFVRPLTTSQIDGYYRESIHAAMLMAIPRSSIPPNHGAFTGYVDAMVKGRLFVSDTARQLAVHLMQPWPGAPLLRGLGSVDLITIGTLPNQIRAGYGFGWGPVRQAALDATSFMMSRAVRVLPPTLRWVPQARDAALRARLFGGYT